MARIKKDSASYFPHDATASSGDTLTVLQGRFNNDGYAFWFKLLEKLTCADGHYLDLRHPVKWQLFITKMGVDEQTTVEILDLLVEMEAVDPELWKSKVIWCQNLVDNLADVYKNRRREIPEKPIITGNNVITTGDNGITTGDNTQSKVKESKEEETKEESVNDIDNKESVLDIYRDLIGEPSEDLENEIELAIKDCTAPWVIDAIREGVKRDRKDWPYIGGILKNWLKNQQLYGNRYGKVSGNRTRSQDPDKYVKGTYGHMTHR